MRGGERAGRAEKRRGAWGQGFEPWDRLSHGRDRAMGSWGHSGVGGKGGKREGRNPSVSFWKRRAWDHEAWSHGTMGP